MQRERVTKSMNHAARKIRAWCRALCKLDPENAPAYRKAMGREALRLEADAILVDADGVNDDADESTKRAG